jgi:outer membrane protein insertion porin family
LCLIGVIVCLETVSTAAGQTAQSPQTTPNSASPAPQSAAPQQPAPAQQQQQQPKKTTPFETVPESAPQPPPQQQPQQPAKPGLEAPPAAPAQPAPNQKGLIERIEFRGARRVPADTLRALIYSRPGDPFNEDALHRDFMALWNTNRFDDIRLETEPGEAGGMVVRFVVTERPVIRTINYEGAKSVSTSEILDRFKERKVGLSVESQYDPAKVQRAAVVLREFLSERGRQFATVTPELRRIPPNSVEVVFRVDEGPKVKVGHIEPEGNDVFNDREVIRAMKNLKPIGIPHSIVLEGLFAKTFDENKFAEDQERIRQAYQDKGYWFAKVVNGEVKLRDVGGSGRSLPFFLKNKPGKRADITVKIEEGKQQRLSKVNYVGVKLFRTPDVLTRQLFQMQPGDVFSTAKLRKGIDNMKKLYADFGYIDFAPEPAVDPVRGTDTLELTMNVDEGKQFFLRRIDFTGNTTTRDKVIRRELLLDEGDIYSGRLWDASILRLNQLGYFDTLKENESYDIKRNPNSNTVDINLKVKEKGKNAIGLNGGVSGISGTFVGFNYSTNNFLGLGETLSLEAQLGTLVRDISIGFTEPYFLDTRLQLGIVGYIRRYNFDQAKQASLLSGYDLTQFYSSLGANNLLNYAQNSKGASLSLSYPIRRSFARVGLTYGFDASDIVTKTDAATNYFQYLNFQTVSGPNALRGIRTSRIVPSYSYNSKNHPITPTQGKSIYIATDFSGSFLGGNVNTVRPTVDIQYFRPAPAFLSRHHVLAAHILGSLITGYGGRVAPPYSRTFIGGEQDIRGFDFYSITPVGYIPNQATVNVYNPDGTQRVVHTVDSSGNPTTVAVTQQIPYYQIITPGGDTQLIGNFEYRIPIFGPVILAPFMDVGLNKILLRDQLKVEQSRIDQLNSIFPGANFDNKVRLASGTQNLRMSTGIELQVMLPVVNAPFRVYWAYNPMLVREYLTPPIVADRSFFPNLATYNSAISLYGRSYPYFERHSVFRFTIGRTF